MMKTVKVKVSALGFQFKKTGPILPDSPAIQAMLKSIPIVSVDEKQYVDTVSEMLHAFWLETMKEQMKTMELSEEVQTEWLLKNKQYSLISPAIKKSYWKWAKAILQVINEDINKKAQRDRKILGRSKKFKTGLFSKILKLF